MEGGRGTNRKTGQKGKKKKKWGEDHKNSQKYQYKTEKGMAK